MFDSQKKSFRCLQSGFRFVVCLALCFALILFSFPTKAEAVSISGPLAIGTVACLILMSVGVVFNPQSEDDIQLIGQDFKDFMYQWGGESEKSEEVETWFSDLSIADTSDDNEWSPNKTTIRLARDLLKGISLWCANIMRGFRQVEKEGEAAPEGFAYYNGHLLPTFDNYDGTSSVAPYTGGNVIVRSSSESIILLSLTTCSDVRINSNNKFCRWDNPSGLLSYRYYYFNGELWQPMEARSVKEVPYGITISEILWTSWDILDANGNVVCPATEISSVATEVVPPVVVGDVSEDLEYGNISDEELPLYNLNYDALLSNPTSPLEDIQDLSGQMASGTLTLEEYLSLGQAVDPSDYGNLYPGPRGAQTPVWTKKLDITQMPNFCIDGEPPVFSVQAYTNDGGTLYYKWRLSGQLFNNGGIIDPVETEYTPSSSGTSFTVPLDVQGVYSLTCYACNVFYDEVSKTEYQSQVSTTSITFVVTDRESDPVPDVITPPYEGWEDDMCDAQGLNKEIIEDSVSVQDSLEIVDSIILPSIDDIDLNITSLIDARGFAAMNTILSVVWENNIVMVCLTVAFIMAMIGFFVFGKR